MESDEKRSLVRHWSIDQGSKCNFCTAAFKGGKLFGDSALDTRSRENLKDQKKPTPSASRRYDCNLSGKKYLPFLATGPSSKSGSAKTVSF